MKKYILGILSLALMTSSFAQNGGQLNENSSLKIEFAGFYNGQTVIKATNKQSCSATAKFTFTGGGSGTQYKALPANGFDTVRMLIPITSNAKVQANMESGCQNYETGVVELKLNLTAMPVTGLETFDEKLDNQGNLLFTWTSYTETNNKQYELEMSTDAINFKRIATIASKADGGSSSMPINYQCLVFPETVTMVMGFGGLFSMILIVMIAMPLVFSKKYRNDWFRKPIAAIMIAVFSLAITTQSCTKHNETIVKVEHGKKYFRLKQVDNDGHYAYSPVLFRTV